MSLCSRTVILNSTGCRTASVKSATTAMRSSQPSDGVTIVDSVAKSSAADAATRKFLASSWATRVSVVGVFALGSEGLALTAGMWT